MDYKKIIDLAIKNGGNEQVLSSSVSLAGEALEYIKDSDPKKYYCLMRKFNEVLFGKHYSEEFALADTQQLMFVDKEGREHLGAHWTCEQIEDATKNLAFHKEVTKWDKYVAFNASYSDWGMEYTDEDVITIGYLFYFADKDWKGSGKIWEYMSIK